MTVLEEVVDGLLAGARRAVLGDAAIAADMERLGRAAGGRLTMTGRGLHCGETLRLLVAGRVLPARLEWREETGWYLVADQEPGDEALAVPARPWLLVGAGGKGEDGG